MDRAGLGVAPSRGRKLIQKKSGFSYTWESAGASYWRSVKKKGDQYPILQDTLARVKSESLKTNHGLLLMLLLLVRRGNKKEHCAEKQPS